MSLKERVADIFRQHPGEWLDGHRFAKVGGFAGWSARVRDLRKPVHKGGYGWHIENRVRYEPRVWGTETITEYRYTPNVAVTGLITLDSSSHSADNKAEHGGQSRA